MTLLEFSTMINEPVEIQSRPGRRLPGVEPWSAELKGAWTTDGLAKTAEHGNGQTPQEALEDYVERIKGKDILLDDGRKFSVPETLSP